jgi:hypothetical protein
MYIPFGLAICSVLIKLYADDLLETSLSHCCYHIQVSRPLRGGRGYKVRREKEGWKEEGRKGERRADGRKSVLH